MTNTLYSEFAFLEQQTVLVNKQDATERTLRRRGCGTD